VRPTLATTRPTEGVKILRMNTCGGCRGVSASFRKFNPGEGGIVASSAVILVILHFGMWVIARFFAFHKAKSQSILDRTSANILNRKHAHTHRCPLLCARPAQKETPLMSLRG
jgi:hypothetical protein